jgi:hypothetical protein
MTEYHDRVDALAAFWQRWAEIGGELSDEQWSETTRCTGWNVAALYGPFARAVAEPPPLPDVGGDPVTAVDILRGFKVPDGVAHAMAAELADFAVSMAAELGRPALVAFFAEDAPRGIAALRSHAPDARVPWPGAAAVTTWAEAVRVVLMEAVVHLLDVLDGLGRPADVPLAGLRDTAHMLADLADPVEFVNAATGASSPP